MGSAEVLTAPRSPWQNPFAERVIGTIRRELLDQVIVLNEGHLRRRLRAYLRYYHGRALTSPSRRMRPSRALSSHLRMAASSRCPRSADSIIDTSVARRSRRASRPCRHILRGWKRDPVLARWISALTAAVAAPSERPRRSIIGGADRATRRSIRRWIEFWPTTSGLGNSI